MTRNNYKIVQWDKKVGDKKMQDYKEIYGYKKSGEQAKKLKKLSPQDETKEPIKYGKFTRHHPDAPDNQKFRHTQTTNKVKSYRRD
jgi:hypothetical protein